MSPFRVGPPPVPQPAASLTDYTVSDQRLEGFPYPAELTRERGGQTRGRLCLGRDEFGAEVLYAVTEPKALVALIKAAWILWAQMMRARHGRHAVMWGQKP